MATDPGISERVYQEIRRRVLAGEFPVRQRLDVARLATVTNASATPVREALARLAVERLIAARPNQGYFAMLWSEAELRALYEWRGELVILAIRQQTAFDRVGANGGEYARRVASLLQSLEKGANPEVRRAALNADDRLLAARRVEPEVMASSTEELEAIEHAMKGSGVALGRRIRQYHMRRAMAAAAIRERALLKALPPNGE